VCVYIHIYIHIHISRIFFCVSSIDMYNNDVGKRFMK
jgi:hypothetical protein